MSRDSIFRGDGLRSSLKNRNILICGAGTLGSMLGYYLSGIGVSFSIVDFDRVEDHNVENQYYGLDDIGRLKVDALQERLYRDHNVEIGVSSHKLDNKNAARELRGYDLILDCFDNSEARGLVTEYCKNNAIDCLHVGLVGGYGSAIWNERYTVPKMADEAGNTCEQAVAKTASWMAVVVAVELVYRLLSGEKISKQFSVDTLAINDF